MDFDYALQYNKFGAPNLARAVQAAERYLRELKPYLPDSKAGNVLEIGPGNGLTLKLLAQEGFESVRGWEVDKSLALIARASGLNVEYVERAELLPKLAASEGAYDLVFGMHVIEHVEIEGQIEFIAAIARSLKPGGVFVCETPNALSPTANYFRYGDWTHTSIFSPASLVFLFESAGLEVIYAGAADDGVFPENVRDFRAAINFCLQKILKFASRGIVRVNLLAELGFKAFDLPLTSSIFVAGRKCNTALSPAASGRSV